MKHINLDIRNGELKGFKRHDTIKDIACPECGEYMDPDKPCPRCAAQIITLNTGEQTHPVFLRIKDENTGDERSYKGWYLQNYGTDYKPSLHIEGTWKTTSISSEALSLIVPKNGASPVQSLQKIGKNGFVATLTNGRSVYCSADDFELDSIYAGGGFFYIVKDGNNYKGIAIDAQTLAIGNTLIGTGSFEFDFVNGVVTTKSITIPAGFKWTKTNAGYIPEYK